MEDAVSLGLAACLCSSPASRHWRVCHPAGPRLRCLHPCVVEVSPFEHPWGALGDGRERGAPRPAGMWPCSPLPPERIGVSYGCYPRAFHHRLTWDNQPLDSWVLTGIKVWVSFALSGAATSSKVESGWWPSISCDVTFWLKCLPVCRHQLVTAWKEEFQ